MFKNFKLNCFLISLSLVTVVAALYLHFAVSNHYFLQQNTIDKHSLFAERTRSCASQTPLLYDNLANKNSLVLCKLGLSGHCKRRSPVEEQEHFYVVCPLYSVNQFSNQLIYKLHTNFMNYCRTLGVKFTQVEYAFTPYQDFIITQPDNEPDDIQIPGRNIFYLRENLVNVAEKKLQKYDPDYEYISWIDAHVHFDNPYIFQEMIVQLGKSNIVAPHSIIRFKDQQNRTTYTKEHPFVYQAFYQTGTPRAKSEYGLFPYYGLAFATRKETFQRMNGLPDTCIGGACDVTMSLALTGGTTSKSRLENYDKSLRLWLENAVKVIGKKFSYVKSTITHMDHRFPMRRYSDWSKLIGLLNDRDFDPYRDLKKDENGTYYFVDNFKLAYDYWKFYASI